MELIRNTPCGAVRGTPARQPGAVAYKGIRYATAGRWEYPTPVTHWEGVYDATQYGAACWQRRAYQPEAQSQNPFYYHEFREGLAFSYSEDCLFLNIFAPADAENAPVIVYIHGGAFMGGSSNERSFDEPVWPRDGAVAVTLNYRLGPLGYACFEELAARDGHTGNYGLYDQLAALQWIHDNIAAFGGDPDNVTIMGQSAGAMSVQHIVSSPLAQGLVHRAVLSSGGGRGRMFGPSRRAEDCYFVGAALLERAGCRSVDELRAVDPQTLLQTYDALLGQDFRKYWGTCGIVVDGAAIPRSIREVADLGLQLEIPYLIGSNSQDMDPSSMALDAQEWASMQKRSSYAYFFSRQLPGDEAGAFHSADLWYWFGTLDRSWRPFTGRDQALSGQMERYLVNFAATGDPNGPELPCWEPGAMGRALCLGDTVTEMAAVDPAALQTADRGKMP